MNPPDLFRPAPGLEEAPARIAPDVSTLAQRVAVRGPGDLTDRELLGSMLAPYWGRAAAACADRMLSELGSLHRALGAEYATLERLAGRDAAAALAVAHEAARRLTLERPGRRQVITSWTQLSAFLSVTMAGRAREEFHVVFLDRKNQLIASELQATGTVDHAPVYPREIIRRALELGASALILAHNHPSGDPTPSRADIDMTKQVQEAGRALQIAVHDHVIVGRDGLTSFRHQGLI